MKDYNPRAFARTQNGRAGAQKGMSLRDYFAGHALNGVLSRTNGWDDDEVISYAFQCGKDGCGMIHCKYCNANKRGI